MNRLPYLDYVATTLLDQLRATDLPAPSRGVAIDQRENVIEFRGVGLRHQTVMERYLSDAPFAPDASAWVSSITGTMSVRVTVRFECELWPDLPYASHYHVSVPASAPVAELTLEL